MVKAGKGSGASWTISPLFLWKFLSQYIQYALWELNQTNCQMFKPHVVVST